MTNFHQHSLLPSVAEPLPEAEISKKAIRPQRTGLSTLVHRISLILPSSWRMQAMKKICMKELIKRQTAAVSPNPILVQKSEDLEMERHIYSVSEQRVQAMYFFQIPIETLPMRKPLLLERKQKLPIPAVTSVLEKHSRRLF